MCTAEHRQLALEAARQGLVLLKNDMDLLPLSDSMQSQRNGRNMDKVGHLAIIGSIANTANKLGGDYSGFLCLVKTHYLILFRQHFVFIFMFS